MNTRAFTDGGITNRDPLLLADIFDQSGINTVGNGIGHDIVAFLDGDRSNPYVLNEYYKSNIDNYRQGVIEFPFENLEIGDHTLTLKVWDILIIHLKHQLTLQLLILNFTLKISIHFQIHFLIKHIFIFNIINQIKL